MLASGILLASLALLGKGVEAAFGVTTASDSYTIDTGSTNPLRYRVNRSNCDINSINFYGTELQYGKQGSHIGSGLGKATVTATQNGESNDSTIGHLLRHSKRRSCFLITYRQLHQGDL